MPQGAAKKKKSPKAGTVGSKYKREKADPRKGMQKHYQSCRQDTSRHMTLGLSPEGTEKHLESRMCAWRWEAIRLFHDLASLSQMFFVSGALLFRQQPKSLVKTKSFLVNLHVTFLAYLLTAIWLHMLLRAHSPLHVLPCLRTYNKADLISLGTFTSERCWSPDPRFQFLSLSHSFSVLCFRETLAC